MKDTKNQILEFWFVESKPQQWFQKNEAFDDTIRTRFAADYDLGAAGIFDSWKDEPEGCLALCILLDQFPRNMFRGRPQSFATDAHALDVARHAIAKRFDAITPLERRRFLYLPFEHSENLEDQDHCVELFKTIRDEDPLGYDYALRHQKVIAQFGRFPHRNAILGRKSTPAEQAYLAQPESGF